MSEYRWQSIKKTTQATGLTRYHLRKLLEQGKLPHIKNGVKVLIDVPKLMQQLQESEAN